MAGVQRKRKRGGWMGGEDSWTSSGRDPQAGLWEDVPSADFSGVIAGF